MKIWFVVWLCVSSFCNGFDPKKDDNLRFQTVIECRDYIVNEVEKPENVNLMALCKVGQ